MHITLRRGSPKKAQPWGGGTRDPWKDKGQRPKLGDEGGRGAEAELPMVRGTGGRGWANSKGGEEGAESWAVVKLSCP